jgi:hypothetical protein
MSTHLPSLWTLGFFEEPAPHSVRAQRAVVRTLADALDQVAPSSDAAVALRAQLAEELARLGSRIEEAASNPTTREGNNR